MRKSLLFIALSLILVSCQGLLTPTLKVGILPEYYVDSSKTLDDSENSALAHNFAKSLEMKLTYVPLEQQELLEGLSNGSIDIVISNIVKIDELPENLTFTQSYRKNPSQAFILRKNSRSMKRKEVGFFLDKKRISWGVLARAHNKNFAKKQISNEIKAYQTLEEGFKALLRREITVFIADYVMVKHHTKTNPFSDITSFNWTPKSEEFVAITADNSPYLEAFNKYITK